ncbi:MAG: 4-hydroxythreonine-4-phosphate dehydrogenase, partial [Planktomarina sp.]|nr:4-hydroxythreonine-4-phosphate dehydrogenase [Planktomarina sp.]
MIPRLPLAVTCGDPAGIGIEVFLAAHEEIDQEIPIVWFGDSQHLPKGNSFTVWSPDKPRVLKPGLNLYQINFKNLAVPGHADPENAAGVINAIETATNFAREGKVAG